MSGVRRVSHLDGNGDVLSWQAADRPVVPPLPLPLPARGGAGASKWAASEPATPSDSSEAPPAGEGAAGAAARAALAEKRAVFIRALASRLGELKELAATWRCEGAGGDALADASSAYIATLRQLRDGSHEWAAVDVLGALAHCRGGSLELSADADAEFDAGELDDGPAALRGGIPTWSFPHATSLRWARLLCPVLEGLLFSVYEDYALVALRSVERLLDALAPLFDVAADPLRCGPADLEPPAAEGADAGADGGGCGEASRLPGAGPEAYDEGAVAGGDGKDAGGDDGAGAQRAALRRRQARRRLAHAAAVAAVEAVRITLPLIAALNSAAASAAAAAAGGSGSGATSTRAGLAARRLASLHRSVAGLTSAAATSVGLPTERRI